MNFVPQDNQAVSTTSSGFNLVAALANLANPAGVVVGYTRDLLRWLERSRVDEASFERCMSMARSLAYPNENGLVLSQSLGKADDRLRKLKQKQLPLDLTFSQALGRLIIKEQEVCWMASTTACLLTHHDIEYTKLALTSMVLDKGGHQTETQYAREVYRAPTKAVISKLVDSIFLNITNPGHQTEKFPPELTGLHIHLVDDTNFAALVMQAERNSGDLILKADRFPGDVVLWLLNHFEGYFEVFVSSKKIYEARLGVSTRKLTAIIQETCSDDLSACIGRQWPVELAETVDGEMRRLVGGSSSEDLKPRSYQRQELYAIENLMKTSYTSYKVYLGREEQNSIKHVARRIVKWLMHVPTNIKDWPQLAGLCFKAEIELDEDRDRSRDFCISELLFRSPSLLQEKTGESASKAPIFRRPQWQGSPISSQNTDPEQWGSDTNAEEVLKNFPCAEEMLSDMQKSCQCPNCRSRGSLSDCKRGCLRSCALLQLCILISHAIADALGAEDVSGAPEPEDSMLGVITLLSETIDQERVRWNTWFQVAACVVAGCSWRSFADLVKEPQDETASSWAGVQYGSLAILAPWLDFCAPADIRESFRILVYEGCITGVKDDVAMIQTEPVPTNYDPGVHRVEFIASPWERLVSADDTPYQVQKVLFSAEKSLHQLHVIVTVNQCLRMIDPIQAIINLARSQQVFCDHHRPAPKSEELERILGPGRSFQVCTFERIFTEWSWDSKGQPRVDGDGSLEISNVLEDLKKLQIALALSDGGVILCNYGKCCLACAVKYRIDSNIESSSYCPILSYTGSTRKQLEGPCNNNSKSSNPHR